MDTGHLGDVTHQFAHVVKRVAHAVDNAEHRANVRMHAQLLNPRSSRGKPGYEEPTRAHPVYYEDGSYYDTKPHRHKVKPYGGRH